MRPEMGKGESACRTLKTTVVAWLCFEGDGELVVGLSRRMT